MLSWVREKLAEGRSRWLQNSQQQEHRNASPPPLPPPPNLIESPATTPTTIDTSMHHLNLDTTISVEVSTSVDPHTIRASNFNEKNVQSTTSTMSQYLNGDRDYRREQDDDSDDTIEVFLPTQDEINSVTENIQQKGSNAINVVNIDELVLQTDIQYDIRKILISLANSCAYVIGAGPYATKIIHILKQKLIQRKRYEYDTQQCLIDMGFPRPKVQHALHISNNIYAAALEWLIENQSPTNFTGIDENSSSMSLSAKFTNNTTIKDNIESLLEIIRIYCQRDLPPSLEMVQLFIDMGFDETTSREALRVAKNHQSYACEWLVGNRSKVALEQTDGLPIGSPILTTLLSSPHVQLSLSNPKIFIAYLSILEDYASMGMWLNDSETSKVIGQVLRTYHEEKHILAINQYSNQSKQH